MSFLIVLTILSLMSMNVCSTTVLFQNSTLTSILEDSTISSLLTSRSLALDHLTTTIMTNKFQSDNKDIGFYFKAGMAFLQAGRVVEANHLLDFVQTEFLQHNGDLVSPDLPPGHKSSNAVYNEYYGYINGWVCRAAEKAGRKDISDPAWRFYKLFQHPGNGGQVTRGIFKGDWTDMTDIFSTANFGLTALEMGDLDSAASAADYIVRSVKMQQPNIHEVFYLRQTTEGDLITEGFPEGQDKFYSVRTDEPGQLWFMLGFPLVLLAKMHQVDNNKHCKETADALLDFYDRGLDDKFGSIWSHKIALGTSYMAAVWKEEEEAERCALTCQKIVTEILKLQDSTGLFSSPGMTQADKIDQTAEISTWWSEIAANLARRKYRKVQLS